MNGQGRDRESRVWTFEWGNIRGEVSALGGMLGPVTFTLPDGEEVQPFAIAPWASDPPERLATLPPVLRGLRGEWPCVPFGMPDARMDLPARWIMGVDRNMRAADDNVHGYASNHCWNVLSRSGNEIVLAVDYPADHPVRRLRRRISRGEGLSLVVTLEIEMRRDAELPVGLHPVFALPQNPGSATLKIPSMTMARTFPVAVEPGTSRLVPDKTTVSLTDLETEEGGTLDLTALPLEFATEELVMVSLTDGRAVLADHDANTEIELAWDVQDFPQCLLWVSNRGRTQYPWDGRFNAIGIEPVAAAFDLGEIHSTNLESPLRQDDTKTALKLAADAVFETSYTLVVSRASSGI
ncbi:hypothetical protein [Hoeflea prorocentri]|uniref:Aldose 1-epimerase n=1 Tax=Hoeflea prorocentri TaxID=1922333 RepID=A0A9X3ZIB1_9HYPH|nr:hypothetical protein [Hoeflea prorocentri]MCY6381823.1 hypothetical protein [Hoeflea prorocentri]MDA5399623.1 hypothetical protein [Hoeflea prorocentri]